MRIYFDNCCYNRPYDDQTQIRISLEAQAKIFIQNAIKRDKIELATSYILVYENNKNPFPDSRKTIADFINEFTSIFIDIDQVNEVILLAAETCAILADCDYFLTTDDRVLKFQSNKINVINPIEFLKVLEANEYVQHD